MARNIKIYKKLTKGCTVRTTEDLYELPKGTIGIVRAFYSFDRSKEKTGVDIEWIKCDNESMIGTVDGFDLKRDIQLLEIIEE
jgi:hypothetical protein